MSLRIILCSFFIVCCLLHAKGQDRYRDSLESLLTKSIPDTTRAKIYIDLAEYIFEESEWLPFNRKALNLANKKLSNSKGVEKQFYTRIKANATGNLGYYYNDHGDVEKSFNYYFESLELYDKAGDVGGKASILGNLGVIYTDQGDYEEALDYLNQALILKLKYSPKDVTKNYLNLGVVYERMNNGDKALWYYQKGLKEAQKVQNNIDISTALNNIGSWHHKKKDYEKAKPFLLEAVNFCLQENDEAGAAWALANLGSCYTAEGNLDSAFYFLNQAKIIADSYDLPQLKQAVYEKLYAVHMQSGNYKAGHEAFLISEKMKDKLYSIDAQKSALKEKMEYDHNLENATLQLKRDEEKKRESLLFYFIVGVLVLVFVFGLFIYSRLRMTRKQKAVIEFQKLEVEKQKDIIEVKNMEIVDSINYAKRLQMAILPPSDAFHFFKDNALLYLPKDIVAGDFYWFHRTESFAYLAVADCTGHGVPGAMVSVVCANALERSVNDHPTILPGELLDLVSNRVIEKFDNEKGDVKDGMDISLVRFDLNKKHMTYAGAFNPCWIIRKGECIEFKANRRPVGRHVVEELFVTHEFECEENDWVYLFTDGFQDQFGGDGGKKYKSGTLKQLLIDISPLDGESQLQSMENQFNNWKGNLPQLDDVCLLGVKI